MLTLNNIKDKENGEKYDYENDYKPFLFDEDSENKFNDELKESNYIVLDDEEKHKHIRNSLLAFTSLCSVFIGFLVSIIINFLIYIILKEKLLEDSEYSKSFLISIGIICVLILICIIIICSIIYTIEEKYQKTYKLYTINKYTRVSFAGYLFGLPLGAFCTLTILFWGVISITKNE